jgi:putative serine protease PepD
VAAVVAAVMWYALPRDRSTTVQNIVRPASKVDQKGLDIPTILAKVRPSVVAIRTGGTTAQGLQQEAAGSGIVLTKDGLVLTNAHVIDGASSIEIEFSDGSTHSATLVGELSSNDVALVRAAGVSDATPATLGSSDAMQVGDDVIAIGNALNLGEQPTVTLGIVSALDRSISAENESLDHLIQTDAAINPGNSGGPLVNAKGQVIGMNTAIIQNSQNLGFALAIDDIKPLIDEMKQGKAPAATTATAFLGIQTTDISETTPDVLQRFGVTVDHGAFVQAVTPGSGADQAGVQPGDVIIGVDGQDISSNQDVGEVIRKKSPGDRVELRIERGGEEMTVTATLGSR